MSALGFPSSHGWPAAACVTSGNGPCWLSEQRSRSSLFQILRQFQAQGLQSFKKNMINLKKKLQSQTPNNNKKLSGDQRISIRDHLLTKEVQEMEITLPRTCRVNFEDPDKLHSFSLTITPEDNCYWYGGKFRFHIEVPLEYNIVPPTVRCSTRIWHPNINEDGEVCLSLLRQNSLDAHGWAPTRKLKDVVWGLNSLFTDLLNFDDPLNVEAAEHYERDKDGFIAKVKEYVQRYAKR